MKPTPKPDLKLAKKLDGVARKILPSGRADVQALIASVVEAGGVSERALVEMLGNRGLEISRVRDGIRW